MTCLCVWEFITHRPLDLCGNDEEPMFSRSSGLTGMPLMIWVFREVDSIGLVCYDEWMQLSALHMIEYRLELYKEHRVSTDLVSEQDYL